MKIQNMKKTIVCMMAAIVCMASSASAQEFGSGSQQVRVAPTVSPMPGSTPRLGFMGQMIYGYGMRVMGTNYGSPANLAGLERGDIIFSINGRRILCQYDYDSALQDAAMYRGGFVSLTVRNVRYDMGLSYQEFVNVSTRVMGYYGGPMPVQGQPGVGPMAPRSAPAAEQAGQKIQEITADQVPKLQAGQQGKKQ